MNRANKAAWIEEVSETALSLFQRDLDFRHIEPLERILYVGNGSVEMAEISGDVWVQVQKLLNHEGSLIVGGKVCDYPNKKEIIFNLGIYNRKVREKPCKINGSFNDPRLQDPRIWGVKPLETYEFSNSMVDLFDRKTERHASTFHWGTDLWTDADMNYIEETLQRHGAQQVPNGIQSIRDQLVPFLNTMQPKY